MWRNACYDVFWGLNMKRHVPFHINSLTSKRPGSELRWFMIKKQTNHPSRGKVLLSGWAQGLVCKHTTPASLRRTYGSSGRLSGFSGLWGKLPAHVSKQQLIQSPVFFTSCSTWCGWKSNVFSVLVASDTRELHPLQRNRSFCPVLFPTPCWLSKKHIFHQYF